MATMRASLSSIVHDIQDGATNVANSTLQISAGNHDLSARTEQQAAALEETASSMEELTSMVAQNADHAKPARWPNRHRTSPPTADRSCSASCRPWTPSAPTASA